MLLIKTLRFTQDTSIEKLDRKQAEESSLALMALIFKHILTTINRTDRDCQFIVTKILIKVSLKMDCTMELENISGLKEIPMKGNSLKENAQEEERLNGKMEELQMGNG